MVKCSNTIVVAICYLQCSSHQKKFKLDKYKLNAKEKLSGIRVDKKDLFSLKDEHALFCPCFVLNARIQYGSGAPQWNESVRVGICIGRSSQHAGNVALVLNLSTGHVSLQFYVVFDDNFEMVSDLEAGSVPKR